MPVTSYLKNLILQPSAKPDTTVFMYGIPSDSFDLVTGHIKRNGFLSSILLEHGVKMEEIDMVIKNSASVFDVRKIRSGNNYTLFLKKDSTSPCKLSCL